MAKRTYVDANVLIAAFRGDTAIAPAALGILSDPDRLFIVSDVLRLATLPKPTFHKNDDEVGFLSSFFAAAAESVASAPALTEQAIALASAHDLTPVDTLHVSAAIAARVDELVTLEKPSKPMAQVVEVRVMSIYRERGS
jgi:predicted nucleic acid-binding protein